VGELDEALRLGWDDPGPDGARVARGSLGEGWLVGPAVNGGLLMALGARALSGVLAPHGHPDVLAWSAFFLSAAQPGPVSLHTEVLRAGRSVSTAQVRLVQEAGSGLVERMRMTATLGDVTVRTEPVHLGPDAPRIATPEECLPLRRETLEATREIAVLDRLDVRVDPTTSGVLEGRPSGAGVLRVWLRMADGREPDLAVLPLVVDVLVPVAFDLGALGWAPTYELAGQVLGRPAPGPLLVRLRTDAAAGAVYVEDADVWDSTGRLVARSRQLAGVRVPDGGVTRPR
jgi:acyl-CoA thioesterase